MNQNLNWHTNSLHEFNKSEQRAFAKEVDSSFKNTCNEYYTRVHNLF